MKSTLLFALLVLPALLFAQQPVVKGERVDDAVIVDKPLQVTESEAMVMDVLDEAAVTRLEPVFQEIEDRYRTMLDELSAQINLAQPARQEELELQAMALKEQLQVERMQAALQYALDNNNTAAAQRAQAAIVAMNNREPVRRVAVERDPVTGAEAKGAAR